MIETVSFCMSRKYEGISFSPEEEEAIHRIAEGDTVAKLKLVKACMDLVVKLANWYALENQKQFSQMVQIGILEVVRAAERFDASQPIEFIDYAAQEIIKAMTKWDKT